MFSRISELMSIMDKQNYVRVMISNQPDEENIEYVIQVAEGLKCSLRYKRSKYSILVAFVD